MKAGDAFLVSGSSHLQVILAVLDETSLIVCHFTTKRRYTDNTCVIKAGEHSFVNHETVVRYDQAHECGGEGLEALKRLVAKSFEPLNADLLARVKQGALDSPQIPEKIKDLLRRQK